jgi:hypothetical protein
MDDYRELADKANQLAEENARLRQENRLLKQHEDVYLETIQAQLKQIERLKDRRLWMPDAREHD